MNNKKKYVRPVGSKQPTPPPKPKIDTKYINYYKLNCFSLDARYFTEVKNQVFEYLKDDNCPDDVKILFGEWLFKKIYMNYKPTTQVKKELCDKLNVAIRNHDVVTAKGLYLQYHDVFAMSLIASEFYVNRLDQEKFFILQLLNDTQLIKNYLQSPDYEGDQLKKHFIEWIKSVKIYEQRSNLLDVLLKNYSHDTEVKKIYEELRWSNNKNTNNIAFNTIYNDNQNVHDKDIQQSVNNVAAILYEWYTSLPSEFVLVRNNQQICDWIEEKLRDIFIEEEDWQIAYAIVSRSRIDTTSFSGQCKKQIELSKEDMKSYTKEPEIILPNKNRQSSEIVKKTFTIAQILLAILHFIHYDKVNSDVLASILIEEMRDMVDLCSSGYIARLMNVLQGFSPLLEITFSVEKQIYASLSTKIMKGLEKAPKEVLEGSIDDTYKDDYLLFVEKLINGCIYELFDNYGKQDVEMFIEQTINKLTGSKCSYINGGIKFILDTKISDQFISYI